jgi:hypothetical protein
MSIQDSIAPIQATRQMAVISTGIILCILPVVPGTTMLRAAQRTQIECYDLIENGKFFNE